MVNNFQYYLCYYFGPKFSLQYDPKRQQKDNSEKNAVTVKPLIYIISTPCVVSLKTKSKLKALTLITHIYNEFVLCYMFREVFPSLENVETCKGA